MTPVYLKLSKEELEERIEKAFQILESCNLCPRNCKVNRLKGEKGFCKTTDKPIISSWGPHMGEEPPLVGSKGSGTIFFTNCNLHCIFCQNYTISHLGEGIEITFNKLASIMIYLQMSGCHNINFVTPTHQVPMILKALKIAIEADLRLPLIYNCGGYESVETLKLLDGIIDIYMPDFKYANAEVAKKYSKAEDYPKIAKAAIIEMHRQVGDLYINPLGIAERGLLVRHLVLPDSLAGTEEVVKFIVEEISDNTYVNIMDQYYPCYKAFDYPPLDRRITTEEFFEALNIAKKAGLKRI